MAGTHQLPPQPFACSLKLLKRVGVEGRSEKKGRRRLSQKREKRTMHQKRTRPETMPAHTQTRRAEEEHTDRQMSADNIVLGFWAPLVFFHCSPDSGSGEELSFPQSRLPSSALTGLGLAPAGTSSPFPTLYRKLSPVPDTFLLHSRASDLHWTFLSYQSTGAIIYPSFLSWKCSPPLVKGSQMSPQMLCLMSESLSGKREGLQDNATHKKGSLLLTQVRDPAASNTVVWGQRAPSPSS